VASLDGVAAGALGDGEAGDGVVWAWATAAAQLKSAAKTMGLSMSQLLAGGG